MSNTTGQSARRRVGTASAEFFIPDLCVTRPVVIMVILAELLVVIYALGDSNLPAFDWGEFALSSLFVQWVVLLSASSLCLFRGFLARLSLQLAALFSLLIILLITILSSLVAIYLLGERTYGGLDGWWLVRNLVVAALISGIVLRYFYLQQQLLLRDQAELTARIESLRSRIRPHFLFNTMNSIASLIGSRPEEAERVVEDLSELFRASLLESDSRATLADELHLCKLYLHIEQLRLGDRMSLRWDLDESALACPLPALLLQPLVENAVYHGVARLPEGGEITISAAADEHSLRITVTNPVPAENYDSGGGHRIALDNIRQRLEAHYQDRASMALRRDEHIFEVSLTIPLQEEDEAQ